MAAKHLCILIAGLTLVGGDVCWAQNDAASPQPESKSPQAPPQPNAAPKQESPPPSVTIIGAKEAHGVLGRDVRSPANEDMGRIVDVIVDRAGVVRAAV